MARTHRGRNGTRQPRADAFLHKSVGQATTSLTAKRRVLTFRVVLAAVHDAQLGLHLHDEPRLAHDSQGTTRTREGPLLLSECSVDGPLRRARRPSHTSSWPCARRTSLARSCESTHASLTRSATPSSLAVPAPTLSRSLLHGRPNCHRGNGSTTRSPGAERPVEREPRIQESPRYPHLLIRFTPAARPGSSLPIQPVQDSPAGELSLHGASMEL